MCNPPSNPGNAPGNARLQPGAFGDNAAPLTDAVVEDAVLEPVILEDTARLEPGVPRGASTGLWHSRGYIPHFDSHHVVQHVTFHLADSLPTDVLDRFEDELQAIPPERQDAERRKRIESWIDAGHGCCLLRNPAAACLVQNAFLFFDDVRYRLPAWVVMPNHVHVLFQSMDCWTMTRIVASWKSFTGRRLAPLAVALPGFTATDRIWHREYWDRYVRDERHFHAAKEYIHNNPVKAGLVRRPEEWEWSSARLTPPGNAGLQPGS